MIMKMTDRACCSNQYRDVPLLDAALWFFIFSGVFGGWLLSRCGLLAFFFRLRGLFDRNLRVVRQTVSTLGDDALAFFQSLSDLNFFVLANPDFDCLLMCVLVVPDHHYGGSAVGPGEQSRSRDHQCVWYSFGDHGQPNTRSGFESLFRIFRLNPDFDGCAVGIEGRTYKNHLALNRFLKPRNGDRRIIPDLEHSGVVL